MGDGETDATGVFDLLNEKEIVLEGESEAAGVALGGPGSGDLDGVIVLVAVMEIDEVRELV